MTDTRTQVGARPRLLLELALVNEYPRDWAERAAGRPTAERPTTLDGLTRLFSGLQLVGGLDDPESLMRSVKNPLGVSSSRRLAQRLRPRARDRRAAVKIAYIAGGLTTVLRVSYGSPVEILLQLSATTSGVPAVFYVVKRLYGLDLEIRTHREKKKKEFFEARRRAEAAKSLADVLPVPEVVSPEVASALDEAIFAEGIRKPHENWRATEGALLWVEEDESPMDIQ